MGQIRIVTENKKEYLPLLLEADPCEAMIDRYLEQGELAVLEEENKTIAAAVVVRLDDRRCELKNIAVVPEMQRKGCGTEFLRRLMERWSCRAEQMMVGTTVPTAPFYRSLGFRDSHVVKNFFTENYPEPIFEGDVPCVDLYYLKKNLRADD